MVPWFNFFKGRPEKKQTCRAETKFIDPNRPLETSFTYPPSEMALLTSTLLKVSRRKVRSGLSALHVRVNGFQFVSSVVNFHLPIDTSLGVVDVGMTSANLLLKFFKFADPSSADALTSHAAEFIFGDVK